MKEMQQIAHRTIIIREEVSKQAFSYNRYIYARGIINNGNRIRIRRIRATV